MRDTEARKLGRIFAGQQAPERTTGPGAMLNWLSQDPWNWLTGRDPATARPLVWTKDERMGKLRPFPTDKPYLREVLNEMRRSNDDNTCRVLLIQKSRQMIVTTLEMLLSLWEICTLPAQRIVLSKVTEDDAIEILNDKMRLPWSQMPDWLKTAWPLTLKPRYRAECPVTGSYALCAAETAARSELRGGTASKVIVDEAAYQALCRDIVEAGLPMARRIDLITTPIINSPGGRFFKAMAFDEEL